MGNSLYSTNCLTENKNTGEVVEIDANHFHPDYTDSTTPPHLTTTGDEIITERLIKPKPKKKKVRRTASLFH